MLKTLAVSNYRSLRDFLMPLESPRELEPLNLITGSNGSGKSNVYRPLQLLGDTAGGGVITSVGIEGGISSTLWGTGLVLGRGQASRPVRTGNDPPGVGGAAARLSV
jgi:predicted ATPase